MNDRCGWQFGLVDVSKRAGRRPSVGINAPTVASWQQGSLASGSGPKTVLNCVQLLSSLFKHARRFRWIAGNPCEDVRKPRYKVKVHAFTAAQVALLAEKADESTALLIRTAASTGLRFGELAGLEWERVDLTAGAIQVRKQFTHGAWSELKAAYSRRRVPLAKELVKLLRLHRLRTPGLLVFPGASGQPLDYHNWRTRVWMPLLENTGADNEHPKREPIEGTFHMLRHFFVTALIQSGVNAKIAQTLAGHHSTSFTLDQYADAIPQQLEEAGERVAEVLLQASGSKTVAGPKSIADQSTQDALSGT